MEWLILLAIILLAYGIASKQKKEEPWQHPTEESQRSEHQWR